MEQDTHFRATISTRGVVLNDDGRYLILKRGEDGQWELPGGRIEPHEGIEECLSRELKEETDLDVDVGDPIHAHAYHNASNQGRVKLYYQCFTADREIQLSAEHREYEWVEPQTIQTRLPDSAATAVQQADSTNKSPTVRAGSQSSNGFIPNRDTLR